MIKDLTQSRLLFFEKLLRTFLFCVLEVVRLLVFVEVSLTSADFPMTNITEFKM